jgi:hypothetical protein
MSEVYKTISMRQVIDMIDELANEYPVQLNGEVRITGAILNRVLNLVEEKKPIQGYELFSVAGMHPIFLIFKRKL